MNERKEQGEEALALSVQRKDDHMREPRFGHPVFLRVGNESGGAGAEARSRYTEEDR